MKLHPYIIASMMVLAACAISPSSQYFILSPSKASLQHSDYRVSRVILPALLDRPQMVMKTGQNEIHVLEYSRWAEPLDSMIGRVLNDDMGAKANASSKRRIAVTINEFNGDENGQVILNAYWVAQGDAAPNKTKHHFEMKRMASGHNVGAIVTAMNDLIEQLADAIAK